MNLKNAVMNLKHAVVQRGGETTNEWKRVATAVEAHINGNCQSIDVHFKIGASGGTSRVSVALNKQDIIDLLNGIAESMPGLASTFADCTALATKKYVAHAKRLAKELKALPADGLKKMSLNRLVHGI